MHVGLCAGRFDAGPAAFRCSGTGDVVVWSARVRRRAERRRWHRHWRHCRFRQRKRISGRHSGWRKHRVRCEWRGRGTRRRDDWRDQRERGEPRRRARRKDWRCRARRKCRRQHGSGNQLFRGIRSHRSHGSLLVASKRKREIWAGSRQPRTGPRRRCDDHIPGFARPDEDGYIVRWSAGCAVHESHGRTDRERVRHCDPSARRLRHLSGHGDGHGNGRKQRHRDPQHHGTRRGQRSESRKRQGHTDAADRSRTRFLSRTGRRRERGSRSPGCLVRSSQLSTGHLLARDRNGALRHHDQEQWAGRRQRCALRRIRDRGTDVPLEHERGLSAAHVVSRLRHASPSWRPHDSEPARGSLFPTHLVGQRERSRRDQCGRDRCGHAACGCHRSQSREQLSDHDASGRRVHVGHIRQRFGRWCGWRWCTAWKRASDHRGDARRSASGSTRARGFDHGHRHALCAGRELH
jgi:hypothetical protein